MEVSISVAMATYNGADYLCEQLKSISDQKVLPCELIVCDDHSTDNTIPILEDFAKTAPFIVKIIINEKNLGPIDNFFKAARFCSGDWICFCDQDDFWLPNKISDARREILENPSLNLVLQTAYLTDEFLVSRGATFPSPPALGHYGSNELDLFFEWHGFLQTVRAELFKEFASERLPINRYRSFKKQSHDQWTCMLSNAIGGISILGNACALYRRHPGAVTGDYEVEKERLSDLIKRKPMSADMVWKSKVCDSYQKYLFVEHKKRMNESHIEDLSKAIDDYRELSQKLYLRSRLYDSRSLPERLVAFFRLMKLGAFWGRSRTTLGLKSGFRDLWFITGLQAALLFVLKRFSV